MLLYLNKIIYKFSLRSLSLSLNYLLLSLKASQIDFKGKTDDLSNSGVFIICL